MNVGRGPVRMWDESRSRVKRVFYRERATVSLNSQTCLANHEDVGWIFVIISLFKDCR